MGKPGWFPGYLSVHIHGISSRWSRVKLIGRCAARNENAVSQYLLILLARTLVFHIYFTVTANVLLSVKFCSLQHDLPHITTRKTSVYKVTLPELEAYLQKKSNVEASHGDIKCSFVSLRKKYCFIFVQITIYVHGDVLLYF